MKHFRLTKKGLYCTVYRLCSAIVFPFTCRIYLIEKQMLLCHTNRKSLEGTFEHTQQKQHQQKMEKFYRKKKRQTELYKACYISIEVLNKVFKRKCTHSGDFHSKKDNPIRCEFFMT